VLARLPQPAVATLSTADALVSLATMSEGGAAGARGSRAGSALFAAAASLASADAEAGLQAGPRFAAERGSPRAPLPAAAARDSGATADAVLSPLSLRPDATADGHNGEEGVDPRDSFRVSEVPIAPLDMHAALRRVGGLTVQEFAATAGAAQRLTFARGEGRAQLVELAAKLRRRCPAVQSVALAMRAGAVGAGERIYSGAIAAPKEAVEEAVRFVEERLSLMAQLMREPTD